MSQMNKHINTLDQLFTIVFRSNIAYNALESKPSREGLQTRFNTPDYRLNIAVGNREFTKNIGFSVNWRWQNSFLWESDFGTAQIGGLYYITWSFDSYLN